MAVRVRGVNDSCLRLLWQQWGSWISFLFIANCVKQTMSKIRTSETEGLNRKLQHHEVIQQTCFCVEEHLEKDSIGNFFTTLHFNERTLRDVTVCLLKLWRIKTCFYLTKKSRIMSWYSLTVMSHVGSHIASLPSVKLKIWQKLDSLEALQIIHSSSLQAVCCSDHEHCCPKGYKCNEAEQACDKPDGLSLPWLQKIPALQTELSGAVSGPARPAKNMCDPQTSCPKDTTCCFMEETHRWGCCPLPNVSDDWNNLTC